MHKYVSMAADIGVFAVGVAGGVVAVAYAPIVGVVGAGYLGGCVAKGVKDLIVEGVCEVQERKALAQFMAGNIEVPKKRGRKAKVVAPPVPTGAPAVA